MFLYKFFWNKLRHSIGIKLFLYHIYWRLPQRLRKRDFVWTALYEVAQKRKSAVFINIGANDGLAGDPLAEFIFLHNWRGLQIEPVPYVFKRLQKLFKNKHTIRCLQLAISTMNKTMKFFYLKKNNSLPAGYDQIGSFNRNHLIQLESMFPGCSAYITSEDVQGMTLQTLLKRYKVTKFDVLLVDTEGYDYEIIKQLDFTRQRPICIIYEHTHLPQKIQNASWELLKKNGYRIIHDAYNTVAKLS